MANTAGQEPHHVDLHVGSLIRAKRKAAGMSQDELAQALGITFQQIQKYERGANRVSSSKLYEISQKLHVPLATFFEGLNHPEREPGPSSEVMLFLGERGSREMMAAFTQLKPALRSRLVALATAMANADQEEAA